METEVGISGEKWWKKSTFPLKATDSCKREDSRFQVHQKGRAARYADWRIPVYVRRQRADYGSR